LKINKRRELLVWILLLIGLLTGNTEAKEEALPASDAIMKAMVDELARSMSLQMEDLEKPYFIQYKVDDKLTYSITAKYGTLIFSDRSRSRRFNSKVRVGSYKLDNTNYSSGGFSFFFGGGAGSASLTLDEDYTAIRQAIWWATDKKYKDAVETLTKKRVYMKDKNLKERPDDFTEGEACDYIEPTAKMVFDKNLWEGRMKKITSRFSDYSCVMDSKASLMVGIGNAYLVNSEGMIMRTADSAARLSISAMTMADDGAEIPLSISYNGACIDEIPSLETVLKDVDEMVGKLVAVSKAPILDTYTGPVLFDDKASAQVFKKMLLSGLEGRVDPVGTQRASFGGAGSLEKKIGQRILPKSFQVYDDPTVEKVGDKFLAGRYAYDSEGVKSKRVDLVKNGKLETMLMSRTPTKKLSGSNGHGRSSSGDAKAAVGSIFIGDKNGLSDEELKKALIEAATDEGLEFALKVSAIRSGDTTSGISISGGNIMSLFGGLGGGGGGQKLGDPVLIYKVYVDDGREELVRGCEFAPVQVKDLKDIIAAGDKPTVYNYTGFGFSGISAPTSIVAPPIIFEEMDVTKIEQEYEKPPILKSPLFRK